jgi:hypothetical protein
MYQHNNIYASKYSDYVQSDALKRSTQRYEKAKKPYQSGIVASSAYSSYQDVQQKDDAYVSSLTGEAINIENFKHNNMQPFLKGGVTQNVEKFTSKLDRDTGVDKMYFKKTEVSNLFKPTPGLDNIHGSKSHSDYIKSRLEVSKVNNNILPFEQVHVGPGLNKGYTALGSGGFQQGDTRQYANPKPLDELRSKVNQRDTYFEIPFKAHAKGTDQRAVVAPYAKNKPEKIYEQNEDNWFKTTGAILKDSNRPELAMKKTHRPDMHIEYQGGAQLQTIKGMSLDDDYGKENITIYGNERQETQTRTVVSNLTSTVKAIVSPVLDALKYNIKEYLVDAPRAGGNPKAQIPNKLSIIDPDDTMKTTTKETLLHDSDTLNLTGAEQSYSALQDEAKTTVKETLLHDSDNLNLTGPDQSYSALQDKAKTTVKETLVHDTEYMNIKSAKNAGYVKNKDMMRTTVKETLPMVDTVRNIGKTTYRVYVYNPDLAVKKTVKETTIKGTSQFGFIGGLINGLIGGYASTNIDLKNTHKQYTSESEEYGVAKAVYEHRPMSREAAENAETDCAREQLMIDAGHTPNPGNMNIPIDKKDIGMKTNKLMSDSYSARDAGNVGVIYQSGPVLDECGLTQEPDGKNAFRNRLDGGILQSLKSNDLNISINPILDIAK